MNLVGQRLSESLYRRCPNCRLPEHGFTRLAGKDQASESKSSWQQLTQGDSLWAADVSDIRIVEQHIHLRIKLREKLPTGTTG